MLGELVGHYLIEEELKQGLLVGVFRARDVHLNRTVALKLLRPGGARGALEWCRLIVEARAASILNHPNIRAVYEISVEEDNQQYISLEYVAGRSLKEILEGGAVPVMTALRYAVEISNALTYAHEMGVLHGDLSSSNVIVCRSGGVKVIDFGLAKMLAEENVVSPSKQLVQDEAWMNQPAGTLPYVAPEIFRGEAMTPQSEIWSFGVLLYQMLTGELPFTGHTGFEVGMAIMTADPPSFRSTAGLSGILRRCLARDLRKRYRLMRTVKDHLEGEYASALSGSMNARRNPWGVRTRSIPTS